ncbi:DUF2771 family protein [Petropleomorpha daqingensis]|uniref:DUF2771 family protein n=1 Tax=Petropleomorpha daqingensis TaxID=2026353 RepID=UPI00344FBA28
MLLAVLTGCGSTGSSSDGPPTVTVETGSQTVTVKPTQYCLDGDGRRYDTTPPVIEVSPDSPITFTVPKDVAAQGWSVQVFDDKLEEKIGSVDVGKGTTVFDRINSSDVVPAAFYLVVVEDKGGPCGVFSGAWPVGFIRPGSRTTGTGSATPSG